MTRKFLFCYWEMGYPIELGLELNSELLYRYHRNRMSKPFYAFFLAFNVYEETTHMNQRFQLFSWQYTTYSWHFPDKSHWDVQTYRYVVNFDVNQFSIASFDSNLNIRNNHYRRTLTKNAMAGEDCVIVSDYYLNSVKLPPHHNLGINRVGQDALLYSDVWGTRFMAICYFVYSHFQYEIERTNTHSRQIYLHIVSTICLDPDVSTFRYWLYQSLAQHNAC